MNNNAPSTDKIDALGAAIAASANPAELLQAVVRRLADLSHLPRDVTAAALHKAAAEWDDMQPIRQSAPHA
ncbi:hypothetical protein VDR48_19935 [Xanthomonas campestris pv. campestris]|nr:hypothetical protein [Xanthomonas campestris pv. campestris]MEB1789647.1 hypothetical protein [Xanthomonas campestris pv. campestris]MEB1844529.1 hypothetical protein [Xanthomonas campestris pv. campestris]MEB1878289.1 hypothetical protein [Xanthomonas campestris pv. campestris]